MVVSKRTIILEFESDNKKSLHIPEDYRESVEKIVESGNYFYIKWDLGGISLKEACMKFLEISDSIKRAAAVDWIDEGETLCSFTLWKKDDEDEVTMVDRQQGNNNSIGKSFGGVFGEENVSPEDYFQDEHDFKLRYWNFYHNSLL